MAASSAHESAPVMVRTPARAQAASSQPGEATKRADSAETRKMPEPIIEPTTIMVASSRLRPRTSRRFGSFGAFAGWAVTSIENYLRQFFGKSGGKTRGTICHTGPKINKRLICFCNLSYCSRVLATVEEEMVSKEFPSCRVVYSAVR